MQQIIELERLGFVFLIVNKKLKYQYNREGLPDSSAALLLGEVKTHKEEAITYLQSRMMDASEAIKLAYQGKLKHSVLIEPQPEYAELWGGAVWLCPDDTSKQRIRQKYPADLALSAGEFFEICEGLSHGEDMRPIIDAMRLFGGSLGKVS
ncbi:hypothetical protein [Sporomusa acidovorans]|uniref:Uncharacterized protein n=1 Tax=Sporomusa acidovorans (strain ATCC 49682 / DSM 3132 / Mol) TaxID=1123286 RepID=A0ABZ3IYA2_SPOA4|nr:hypothetical protein [Sporomusa acidovorans]OZC22084.1 hypothetical protein SPACI_16020 [Sporomusa acidovorans DSM 3132]SDF66029.1 hypothetical protein SAMN04488499_10669 [Sporomusa acidovorans]